MFVRASLAVLLTLSACSSDSNSSNPVDAATADTSSNTVQKVTCPATVALTVTTDPNAFKFAPTTPTIAVGGIVHFQLASSHNAVPKSNLPSDPGLNVGFGGDVCLKFTQAGTFNFTCSAHGFSAAITVQ